MAKSLKTTETKSAAAPTTAGHGQGTRASPWVLKTPSQQSEFTAFRDETLDPPALVVQVGKTELRSLASG